MNKLVILVVVLGVAGGFFFTKMKKDNTKSAAKSELEQPVRSETSLAVDVPIAEKGPAIIKESAPGEDNDSESRLAVEEYAATLPKDQKEKYLEESKKNMDQEKNQADQIAKNFSESKKVHIKKSRDQEIEEKYQKSVNSRDINIARESDGGSMPEKSRSASSSSQLGSNSSTRNSSLTTTPSFGGNNPVGN